MWLGKGGWERLKRERGNQDAGQVEEPALLSPLIQLAPPTHPVSPTHQPSHLHHHSVDRVDRVAECKLIQNLLGNSREELNIA